MTEKKLTTLMAFDYGTKNIGIATGQLVTRTANAIAPIKARDGIPDWNALQRIIEQWQPDAFIVGIPTNMDGSEQEMTRRARKFANRLTGRYNKPWHSVDERLSTFEAKEWADRLGHRGHYASVPVDSMAAQMLLESWMNDPANQVIINGC